MRHRIVGRAPDYTTPALIFLGLNLFFLLLVVWQTVGWLVALALAFGLNHLITRAARRQS